MSYVVTLAVDAASQGRFDALRERYFPPERNLIPAHITLFHNLPEDTGVVDVLKARAAETRPFSMEVSEMRSIGKGVALFLRAHQAVALHGALKQLLAEVIIPQDNQPLRPHMVIQNKVSPQMARETLALLQPAFHPWQTTAVGLDLWRYLNGPWEHLQRFSFAGEKAQQA